MVEEKERCCNGIQLQLSSQYKEVLILVVAKDLQLYFSAQHSTMSMQRLAKAPFAINT